MSTTVEGEVVDETPGTELAVAPRRGEVIRPLDLAEVKHAMQAYQQGVRQLLDPSDYQAAGKDRKTGKERKFVKKAGLRKIATWFDLSVQLLRDDVDRAPDGTIQRATVWARATAANGRFFDGDGHCDASEERFQDAKGRQKLENDLRATAATRAMNRAIAGLIGMGDLDETGDGDTSAAGNGPEVDAAIAKTAKQACTRIAGGEADAGVQLWRSLLGELGGYMPHAAALALIAAAGAIPQTSDG